MQFVLYEGSKRPRRREKVNNAKRIKRIKWSMLLLDFTILEINPIKTLASIIEEKNIKSAYDVSKSNLLRSK